MGDKNSKSFQDGVKVLSLFDGMSCGMIAMLNAGMNVTSYDAYEIDKYAIKTSTNNFPMINQHGDVFLENFKKYKGIDYLIGGSPCTYWSIAQKNDRETEASGIGWELFSQYVRAVKEAEPKFFIYENNKSMSKQIRDSIDLAFGFSAVCINSALVSAQNRQRLYWVGKRNEDGTYSKVNVEQPEDRGILIKDIIEYVSEQNDAERIPSYGNDNKARPIVANYPKNCGGFEHRVWSDNPSKQQVDLIAEPVCMRYERTDEAKRVRKDYEAGKVHHGFHELSELHPRTDGKTNTLSTVLKDNPICEPIRVGGLPRPNGELSNSQAMRVYDVSGKSVNITAGGGGMGGKTGLYAIPLENGTYKGYPVYTVKDGKITIKGREYPIKLNDGYYIIRKLSVRECMRLQTVPEWYDFSCVSNSQAYKMLGNGWTCDVISHLIIATKAV